MDSLFAFAKRSCEYVALIERIKTIGLFPNDTCVLLRRNKISQLILMSPKTIDWDGTHPSVTWLDIGIFAPSRDNAWHHVRVLVFAGNHSPCHQLTAEHGCNCKTPSSLFSTNVWKCRVESFQFSAYVFAWNSLRLVGVFQNAADQTVH